MKVLKYVFYPIYLTSTIQGRPRYFLDYLMLMVLGGCLYVLANCAIWCSSTFASAQTLVGVVVGLCMGLPIVTYFVGISS